MNIQPMSINASYNSSMNKVSKKTDNTSFKAIVPHGFKHFATKETTMFFQTPNLHKLVKGLQDVGKDLHVVYEPSNLRLEGTCGYTKIPEMYDLYISNVGEKAMQSVGKIVANEEGLYPEIDVFGIMQKVTGKCESLKDVNVKSMVDYLVSGINSALNKM